MFLPENKTWVKSLLLQDTLLGELDLFVYNIYTIEHIICVYLPCHSSMLYLSLSELSPLFSKQKSWVERGWILDSLFLPVIHRDNHWRLCGGSVYVILYIVFSREIIIVTSKTVLKKDFFKNRLNLCSLEFFQQT